MLHELLGDTNRPVRLLVLISEPIVIFIMSSLLVVCYPSLLAHWQFDPTRREMAHLNEDSVFPTVADTLQDTESEPGPGS